MTLGEHTQFLPHAQLQSPESGCVHHKINKIDNNKSNQTDNRARNSARIRESILAMILVASRYENQFLH